MIYFCLHIPNAGIGPFVNCHDVVNPTEFFDDCTYDYCATQDAAQLCEDVATYAEACQLQGVQIREWRGLLGCGKALFKTS